jgi:DNA primase
MPLSDFLFNELTAQTELDSQEGRVRLAKLAEPYLARLTQAPLLARAMKQRLATLTGLEPPRERFTAQPRLWQPRAASAATASMQQGRARVQPSHWRILLQAVCHDPARARQLGELTEAPNPDAQALMALVSLLREHPEIPARDLPDHFHDRPEAPAIRAAMAEQMHWPEDYDVEADFLGSLNAVISAAQQQELAQLTRVPLPMQTPEQKQRISALIKASHLRRPGST